MKLKNYNILIILLLSINFACSQENKKLDLKGNWYNINKSNSVDVSYRESYFSETSFYFFDHNLGLKPGLKYILEEDRFYLSFDDEDIKQDFIKIKFIEDILEMNVKGTIIYFKRLKDDYNTLEEYVNKQITEKVYMESFLERKSIWEELGYLID